jgi:signal transduction histidine kinase
MPRRPIPISVVYAALGLISATAAILISFTGLGTQLDNNLHDFFFRLAPVPVASVPTAVLAFDEPTLRSTGGQRNIRPTLTKALEALAPVEPACVAIDLTLTDPGDPEEDAALARALARFPCLVLASEMLPDGSAWQDPVPVLAAQAKALGHVGALRGPLDDICRRIPLERVAGHSRRWAMSLETWRLLAGVKDVVSSPTGVELGDFTLGSRWDDGRPMRVRFRESSFTPSVSVSSLLAGQDVTPLRKAAVFVGVTAISASDRFFTPLARDLPYPGVEIHAQAYQTISNRLFLEEAPPSASLLSAIAAAALAVLIFTFAQGLGAILLAAGLVLTAFVLPYSLQMRGLVLPPTAPMIAAWLASLTCGGIQYLVIRRRMGRAEESSERYQKTFRFVAHELRTPLTAIQGSSELMTRYNLPEQKQRELSLMVNSESKRLARMITTFLDVEKLAAGQMELRLAPVAAADLVDTCYQRAMPLAERKRIRVTSHIPGDLVLKADRELIEYALYNLLTNAIKYSPEESEVEIRGEAVNGETRVAVKDQGIGMDLSEQKNLFRKFYRTRRAEASGETGTGIGLSIVREMVALHGGRIDVVSAPDQGSTFTLVLPA